MYYTPPTKDRFSSQCLRELVNILLPLIRIDVVIIVLVIVECLMTQTVQICFRLVMVLVQSEGISSSLYIED